MRWKAPLPKKLTASGEAAPERKNRKAPAPQPKAEKPAKAAPAPQAKSAPVMKPRFGPGAENRAPVAPVRPAPKGGQAIVIGKGGKLQTAAPKSAPAQSAPKASKLGIAKPVKRVNRARGRNGER